MQVIVDPKEMLAYVNKKRAEGLQIGFVPTMGFLHAGHLSLIKKGRAENTVLVCSIFVNPAQFGPGEDFKRYPRDLDQDKKLAADVLVDVLFCPKAKDLYGHGYSTFVSTEKLSEKLCGRSRPAHFRGVTTVVAKLFNLTKPHNAYFGQKDAQQFVIIKRMVDDLHFDLRLHMLPIVRENDHLALSSRNQYLSPTERKAALVLPKALQKAEELLNQGTREAKKVIAATKEIIAKEKLARLEYAEIVDLQNLEPVKLIDSEPVLLALAVYIGKTRLIDNLIFNRENYVI